MFKYPETKGRILGFTNMIAPKEKDENSPIEGQDFADPKEGLNKIPSSHGEVANQKGGDFSELEESRMEHPPEDRDENGSSKDDLDTASDIDQSNGVK